MSIRRAGLEDVPLLAPCAKAFCETLEWPLNEEHFLSFIAQALRDGSGAVFLLELEGRVVGGIGGTMRLEPVSGKPVAVESFWYVLPGHRGGSGPIRLIQAFERWGFATGAHNICMISMQKSMPEEMDRLYSRLGYRKLETTYIK